MDSLDRQETDTKTSTTENFTHYVHYNQYGGVEKRIERELLETILNQERRDGWFLINTIWSLRREGEEIHAKLNPSSDLGSIPTDNLWHSWNYTFVPEVL